MTAPVVMLDDIEVTRLWDQARRVAELRRNNPYYENQRNLERNLMTGMSAEYAVFKFMLAPELYDWGVGASNVRTPDLLPLGYRVGVKSFTERYLPIILEDEPQVLVKVINNIRTPYEFEIVGVVRPETWEVAPYHRNRQKNVLTSLAGLLEAGSEVLMHQALSEWSIHASVRVIATGGEEE